MVRIHTLILLQAIWSSPVKHTLSGEHVVEAVVAIALLNTSMFQKIAFRATGSKLKVYLSGA
jgi:hypothetical protein